MAFGERNLNLSPLHSKEEKSENILKEKWCCEASDWRYLEHACLQLCMREILAVKNFAHFHQSLGKVKLLLAKQSPTFNGVFFPLQHKRLDFGASSLSCRLQFFIFKMHLPLLLLPGKYLLSSTLWLATTASEKISPIIKFLLVKKDLYFEGL